jgi:heptosyltransferase III
LPMAGTLKQLHPEAKIYFIGRTYTKPIVDACKFVDEFINWDEIEKFTVELQVKYIKSLCCDTIVHVLPNVAIAEVASLSKIPIRIGTSHRFYHWVYCNKLVNLGRKKSALHESQLNIKLLKPLGVNVPCSLAEIPALYGLSGIQPAGKYAATLLDPQRLNLILHPKSKGSAREWGLDNFGELIDLLPREKYKIFISGTKDEGALVKPLLEKYKADVTDITGTMSLVDFISFINAADGLVSASTGPLHIAAALGKIAVGLYSPKRPIHPGRWQPVGEKARYLAVSETSCKCRSAKVCECIGKISAQQVMEAIEQLQKVGEEAPNVIPFTS